VLATQSNVRDLGRRSLQSVRLSGRGGEMRRSEPAAAPNFLEMLDKLREIAANWPI
jgi:hypothetical protein